MSRPSFSLTGKIDLTVYRKSAGDYNEGGYWVEGSYTPVIIKANVQPAQFHEIKTFPESEHTKKWVNVWSASLLRTMKEGEGGHSADMFYFEDDLYEIRKAQKYSMGVLDHSYAMASRVSLTPDGFPSTP